MGLFDKLRDTVDNAKNSINKAIESVQNTNDPLSDPVVKQYFEIICGMRKTFLSTGPEAVTNNEKAKKYIEYFLGAPCDREKLERALELYNLSRNDSPSQKTETIVSDFRKSLTKSTRYQLNKYQAQKMFCQREIELATEEYNRVIDVIKENPNYIHFSQGIRKMQYSSAIKDIVIYNSFCEGNPIIKHIVLEFFIDSLLGRINSETYNTLYDSRDDVALVVLKALHFEKYGQQKEGYTTITDNDYRNFVLGVPYYNRVIEDNPFDKEEYISKFVKRLKSCQVFHGVYSSFKNCFHISSIDDYFCDSVCYLTWKSITQVCNWTNADGENISKSKNMEDIFYILLTYLNEPDEFDNLEIIEQFFDDEDEETGDVEVYSTISDDVISRLEAIDLEDEEP